MGIAGICLIRLKNIKPQFIRGNFGLSSENAAHRIAVEWDEDGVVREGVYIPRRDTSSKLNTLVGGKLFPGVHHHAHFTTVERGTYYRVALDSHDDQTHVLVEGHTADALPTTSIFASLSQASDFFEAGTIGYSATPQNGQYDGLELRTLNWQVAPLAIDQFESSFFENKQLFPEGSLHFDCALVMQNIQHEWHGLDALCHPA